MPKIQLFIWKRNVYKQINRILFLINFRSKCWSQGWAEFLRWSATHSPSSSLSLPWPLSATSGLFWSTFSTHLWMSYPHCVAFQKLTLVEHFLKVFSSFFLTYSISILTYPNFPFFYWKTMCNRKMATRLKW